MTKTQMELARESEVAEAMRDFDEISAMLLPYLDKAELGLVDAARETHRGIVGSRGLAGLYWDKEEGGASPEMAFRFVFTYLYDGKGLRGSRYVELANSLPVSWKTTIGEWRLRGV